MGAQPQDVPDGQPRAARVVIEVTAGVTPGIPDPDRTRRYVVLQDDWDKATAAGDDGTAVSSLLADTNGRAQGYAAFLMLQPDRVNWVLTEWVYL